MSYQRQDLGVPPVVTPQYERIVGGDNTSVTLSGLKPGTTYRIRVWSTDGTSVSSGAREMDVKTVESGEFFVDVYTKKTTNILTTVKILEHIFRPVRYFDIIVYRDDLSNIAIRYFLLAIAITATEIIMC